jgi:transcriptional regulator with XRE-family HTH domain
MICVILQLANLKGGVSVNRIKELRMRAGLQQKEIAIAAGVSRPTVSEWEHQKKDPTGERLKKLAALFDVSTGVILCLDPYESDGTASDATLTKDEDIWELREKVRRDPERHYLFSLASNGTIDDVRRAVAIIDALKQTK